MLNFERSLTVGTFLGGFMIGVLTFLFQVDEGNLQNRELSFSLTPADYKKILIIVAGIATTFLILSVFAIKVVIVDKRKGNELFSITALYTYEAGFVGLAILLPLLVYPFSLLGTIIISLIEIGWAAIFVVYKKLPDGNYNNMSIDQSSDDDPLKILKIRLAKGEISREQYEEMRKMLRS